MERVDALANLLATYGSKVDIDTLGNALYEGIDDYVLSVEGAYNGLRMALGKAFGVKEYFTVEDVMSVTGESREEVVKHIQEMLDDAKANGENPDDYAMEIDRNKTIKFILPKGYLN